MRACFLFPALAAALAAQGAVPPYRLGVTNPMPGLSAPNIPGSSVQQVHMLHYAGDPTNVFRCSMTVTSLPSNYGGVGGSDLVTGTYDVLTDTFTPNAEAAALNTAGTEFGLVQHHSGLFAMFDRLPGPPQLAFRTGLNQPWQLRGSVSPIPTQSYYDPSLADYNGQTYLLHVLGNDIAMTPIDLNTGGLGTSTVIIHGVNGGTANSPTPVYDLAGQLIGVSHHNLVGADNDHYLSLDLDPNTPANLVHDDVTWRNNGGFIGGRFFDAESSAPAYHVLGIDTFWFTGGRSQPGGTMSVRFFSPPTTSLEFYFSLIAVNGAFLSAPMPFPPALGLLGLQPLGAATALFLMHDNNNGEASVTWNIPNQSSLHGTRMAAQSVTLASLANQIYLGNTASLTIE
jgi:hypothetical protein